ncbi:MAG: T9SS type A sorting domain-containing protein [Ginsengibacter sp.]
MKTKILLSVLSLVFFTTVGAQSAKRAFAITGQASGNFNWTDIRTIDLSTGTADAVLFENGKTKFSLKDIETKKSVESIEIKGNPASLQLSTNGVVSGETISITFNSPTDLLSAAMAYDQRHEKLFFSSLHGGKLMWLDLRSPKENPSFYTVSQPLFESNNWNDEGLNITRMAIGADGNGYTITNDGNHLIRFTTGKKIVITDLGELKDALSNNGVSVHNKATSWGGDIVADAFGKLYLFSAFKHVFEIDINSRVAKHKGVVSGLPSNFSLNGAAAEGDENVVISSANTFDGFYKVNIDDLSAIKLETKGQVFNASDLASSHLLKENQLKNGVAVLKPVDILSEGFVSLYPNPVPDNKIKISFDNISKGDYEISVTDLQGKLISKKKIRINNPGHVEDLKFNEQMAKGMYLIKIINSKNESVFADKLLIQ